MWINLDGKQKLQILEQVENSLGLPAFVVEKYNVTPNFFIYGYIDDFRNWHLNEVKSIGTPSYYLIIPIGYLIEILCSYLSIGLIIFLFFRHISRVQQIH